MEIKEQFCIGKREGKACEDGWVVTADFAAVVDGSTSKIKIAEGQESPGHLAMRLVCEAIRQLPATCTKEEALIALTQVLAADQTYATVGYRPTCSAVVYSAFRKEVWFIGDCQARWSGQTHHYEKAVDAILTDIRCRAVSYFLAHGYTEADIQRNDKGRAFIHDALCEQLHFQNDPDKRNPYRYVVLDGQPIDSSLVPALPVIATQELILASDGYPQVFDTLEASEEFLYKVLKKDPLCIHENRATKCLVHGNRSFDDRTYLRIRL